MKIIDPHVDVVDLYKSLKIPLSDFVNEKSSTPPVSLSKIEKTGIDVIGFSLYFDSSFLKTNFYDGVKEFYGIYQDWISSIDKLWPISSADDFENKTVDKIGFFYSIEGFDCLRTPDDFDEFYELGVRSFGMTWSYDNKYACGRSTKDDVGLSILGKEVVRRMNTKKLIVDIAHLSIRSIMDLEKYFQGMIVTTHGNVQSICNEGHNLSDDEIQVIVDRGGVVSLFPLVDNVGGKGSFEDLYRHLDYIASKWGFEYIGFSSDIYPIPEYPFINNAQDILILKDIWEYLLTRLSKKEVEQVMWGNWSRVLREAL